MLQYKLLVKEEVISNGVHKWVGILQDETSNKYFVGIIVSLIDHIYAADRCIAKIRWYPQTLPPYDANTWDNENAALEALISIIQQYK